MTRFLFLLSFCGILWCAALEAGAKPARAAQTAPRVPIFIPGQTATRPSSANQGTFLARWQARDIAIQGSPWHSTLLTPAPLAMVLWDFSPIRSGPEAWIDVEKSLINPGLFSSNGLLDVAEPEGVAADSLKPRFPERWKANICYRWRLAAVEFNPSLRATLGFTGNQRWGYELGIESDLLSISIVNELPFPGLSESFYSKQRYLDQILQIEAQFPLSYLTLYMGGKTHLREKDLWVRAGIRFPVDSKVSLDIGMDFFTGPRHSYFGKRREKTRVYAIGMIEL